MGFSKCALCKQYHVIKVIQVDHIDGSDYSLKTVDDIQQFLSIVLVTSQIKTSYVGTVTLHVLMQKDLDSLMKLLCKVCD